MTAPAHRDLALQRMEFDGAVDAAVEWAYEHYAGTIEVQSAVVTGPRSVNVRLWCWDGKGNVTEQFVLVRTTVRDDEGGDYKYAITGAATDADR